MKKPEKARHREDGECGCKYMEDEAPCEIKMEARNQAIDEYEKYHNEEIAKLEKKVEELEKEVKVDNTLIAERDRILEKYPCPEHGKCVPYILEQLAQLNALREKVENLEGEINYLYEQGDL